MADSATCVSGREAKRLQTRKEQYLLFTSWNSSPVLSMKYLQQLAQKKKKSFSSNLFPNLTYSNLKKQIGLLVIFYAFKMGWDTHWLLFKRKYIKIPFLPPQVLTPTRPSLHSGWFLERDFLSPKLSLCASISTNVPYQHCRDKSHCDSEM